MASPAARKRSEAGTGVVASAFGAVVFLSFVLLATHVALGLYSSSVVTSTAFDAASMVARAPEGDEDATRFEAEAMIRQRLSSSSNAALDWRTNADGDVGLHITAARPAVLPSALAEPMRLDTTRRTVWVRREVER